MRALVVYESLYGNTRAIAEAIGGGLETAYDVKVVSVRNATAQMADEADLLVVGGPTHVHGVSSTTTRKSAIQAASNPASGLTLDPDAGGGPGLREWLEALTRAPHSPAASFDTRMSGPAVFTGRASLGIARRLRHRGFPSAAAPESFLVDRRNRLYDGELERARAWGESLSARRADDRRTSDS
jgi:hypothetical protein